MCRPRRARLFLVLLVLKILQSPMDPAESVRPGYALCRRTSPTDTHTYTEYIHTSKDGIVLLAVLHTLNVCMYPVQLCACMNMEDLPRSAVLTASLSLTHTLSLCGCVCLSFPYIRVIMCGNQRETVRYGFCNYVGVISARLKKTHPLDC